jgi:hypothetical protein
MFARGVFSFYPAPAPASPKNLPSRIIPTHARLSCKSNYSRTYEIPREWGMYRFFCQTNSLRF